MIAQIVLQNIAKDIASDETGVRHVHQGIVGVGAGYADIGMDAVGEHSGNGQRDRLSRQGIVIGQHRQDVIGAFPRHAIVIRIGRHLREVKN